MDRANPLGRAFTRLVGTSTAKEVRGRRLTAVFVNEPAYGPGVRREAVEVLWGALARPGYCLLEGFQDGRVFYPRYVCVWGSVREGKKQHVTQCSPPTTNPHAPTAQPAVGRGQPGAV